MAVAYNTNRNRCWQQWRPCGRQCIGLGQRRNWTSSNIQRKKLTGDGNGGNNRLPATKATLTRGLKKRSNNRCWRSWQQSTVSLKKQQQQPELTASLTIMWEMAQWFMAATIPEKWQYSKCNNQLAARIAETINWRQSNSNTKRRCD